MCSMWVLVASANNRDLAAATGCYEGKREMCCTGCVPYAGKEVAAVEYHGVCGARQQVWDWIRSYTKPGTVYDPVKPLRECPICELPELSHILQQLLWYYTQPDCSGPCRGHVTTTVRSGPACVQRQACLFRRRAAFMTASGLQRLRGGGRLQPPREVALRVGRMHGGSAVAQLPPWCSIAASNLGPHLCPGAQSAAERVMAYQLRSGPTLCYSSTR